MAVSWTEAHQADGSLAVDVDNTPEIRAALVRGRTHVLLSEDDEVITRYVLTGDEPSRSGIKLTARALSVLLGSGSDGPTIVDAEYVAATNKLGNPSFELFGAGSDDPLYWKLADPTFWNLALPGTGTFAGAHAALLAGLPTDDDAIVSTETYEAPPGSVFEVAAKIFHAQAPASVGRLRLRLVFEGVFARPDLAQPYSTWSAPTSSDITLKTDPTGAIPGPVYACQSGRPNLVPNGGFDDGSGSLNGFWQGAGNWYLGSDGGWDGAHYAFVNTSGANPPLKYLQSSADGAVFPPILPQPVQEGEEYEMRLVVRPHPGVVTDGTATMIADIVAYDGQVHALEMTEDARGTVDGQPTDWHILRSRFTVVPSVTGIIPQVNVANMTQGQWDVDTVTLFRTKGSKATVDSPPMAVVPNRSYRWTVPFRVDPGVTTGSVTLQAVCSAEGRTDVVVQGMAIGPGVTGVASISWDCTPPSGYDTVRWRLAATDIDGGGIWVGQGTLRDNDPKTAPGINHVTGVGDVADLVLPTGSYNYTAYAATFSAPVGAEKVHLEIIGEANASWFAVDDVSVRRTDAGPTLATDVVADLLNDPHTGLAVLTPGVLHDAGNIAYDWHPRNVVLRDALTQLSTTGQVDPPREYRVNPDRTYDWGSPVELFTDHANVILRRGQFRLLSDLVGASTIDKVVDSVHVVGADRQRSDGTHVQITAEASLPTTTTYDAFGRPLRQTRTVADSGADHLTYATQLAAYDLAQAQPGPPSVSVEVSDPRAWGSFAAGDWIYVYDPDAELVDPDNEMVDPDTGETVWPLRLRILDATKTYARGNRRVELVDPATQEAGSGLDITDAVRWSDKTTQQFTLGSRRPEFLTNPGNANVGDQLRRFLASTPR